MDTTVNQLNELFRQGIITEQAYADGLDVINSRRERPTPAPRAQALRNDTPTQPHARKRFGMAPLPRLHVAGACAAGTISLHQLHEGIPPCEA